MPFLYCWREWHLSSSSSPQQHRAASSQISSSQARLATASPLCRPSPLHSRFAAAPLAIVDAARGPGLRRGAVVKPANLRATRHALFTPASRPAPPSSLQQQQRRLHLTPSPLVHLLRLAPRHLYLPALSTPCMLWLTLTHKPPPSPLPLYPYNPATAQLIQATTQQAKTGAQDPPRPLPAPLPLGSRPLPHRRLLLPK